MAYSTNIYDLYKKVEENHHNIDEAMKMKFAVVNNNGEVIGFTSDEKDAMSMAKNNLRKEKGTVVKLSKPMPQKQADMKIGRKLFAQNTREYLETAKVVKEKLDKEQEKDEGFASDAQRRAAFAQGYKAKGKKGKKEEVKEKLMNAYRQQWKELGEKRDPADIDMKATSKDQEMADQNVVMQLRKAGNLGGTKEVKFGDGKKVKVKPQIAQRVMSKMMTLRTTQEKEKFQQQIGKSYKDLLNALK